MFPIFVEHADGFDIERDVKAGFASALHGPGHILVERG
jgi:hypothetical protein